MPQHKRLPKTLFLMVCLLVLIGCSSDEKQREFLFANDFDCTTPFDKYSNAFQPPELGAFNRPGSYMATVKSRVVDGNNAPRLVDVDALVCDFNYRRECDVVSRSKTDSDGRFVLQIPKAPSLVFLAVSQDGYLLFNRAIPSSSGGTIDLGTIVLDKEPQPSKYYFPQLVNFSGVLLDESSNPVAAIRVSPFIVENPKPSYPVVSYSYTDSRGRFDTDVRAGLSFHVMTHTGPIWISTDEEFRMLREEKWGRNAFYLADSRENATIQLKSVERVEIQLIGKEEEEVEFSLYGPYPYHQQLIPLSTLKLRFHRNPKDTWLRVRTPGHLSRLIQYPRMGEPLIVDFSQDIPVVVQVTSGGKAVNGARVDFIESFGGYRPTSPVPSNEWSEVDSFTSDGEGRVFVKGERHSGYVACAYAESYVPSCLKLDSSFGNELELVRKNRIVEFEGLERGDYLRLKIAGTDVIEYAKPIEKGGKLSIPVAPGKYDATIARRDKGVVRGFTFEVKRSREHVDLRKDNRPRVTVSLPTLPGIPDDVRQWTSFGPIPDQDLWHVSATRSMPIGSFDSRMGELVNPHTFKEPGVEVFKRTDHSISFRLSGSGDWIIYLAPRYLSLDYWLTTELYAEANSSIALKLRELNSTLIGEANFDTSGKHSRGFAEPRLALLTMKPQLQPWNIFWNDVELDHRKWDWPPKFTISHLPAGDYRLEHHLDTNQEFNTLEYEGAWGARNVTLFEDRTTNVGNISNWNAGRLNVEVVDSEGNAVVGKWLRIKDRLYESWDAFLIDTSESFVGASYPLKKPPAWQLDGDILTVDSVREGWIEFELVDELGCTSELLLEIPETGGYRVTLPKKAN